MRIAVYSRVSTADRDQQPKTQLLALREHCARMGWEIVFEAPDIASATDLRNRNHGAN